MGKPNGIYIHNSDLPLMEDKMTLREVQIGSFPTDYSQNTVILALEFYTKMK